MDSSRLSKYCRIIANFSQFVDEVKYCVEDFQRDGIIPAIDEGVVKSDCRISPILQSGLQNEIACLRKDTCMQFGSVDVVDLYFFPFTWARTRTLRDGALNLSDCIRRCGEGETVKMPSQGECVQADPAKYPNDMAWSRRFRCLLFDVKFDERGEEESPWVFDRFKRQGFTSWNYLYSIAKISSYINNVYAIRHQSFYDVLERLINAAIFMFDQTLIHLKSFDHSNQRFYVAVLERNPMIVKEPRDFRPPQQRSI